MAAGYAEFAGDLGYTANKDVHPMRNGRAAPDQLKPYFFFGVLPATRHRQVPVPDPFSFRKRLLPEVHRLAKIQAAMPMKTKKPMKAARAYSAGFRRDFSS